MKYRDLPRCSQPFILAAAFYALGGCVEGGDTVSVLKSNRVEFGDLFAFEDSIRLDSAVLLGDIEFLDVSTSGEFLVSDEVGQGVYLFSPAGGLLSEMVIDVCAPGAEGFTVSSAVFFGDDRIVAIDGDRGYVFDKDGNCIVSRQAIELLTTQAICARGDTIFAWQQAWRDARQVIGFSDQLEPVTEIGLPLPELPALSSQYYAWKTRAIACFDDGPWVRLKEAVDARPMRTRPDLIHFEPFFYRPMKQDMLPIGDPGWRRRFANAEGTWLGGVFALQGSVHLAMYTNLPERYHHPDWTRTYGLAIVDHADYSFSASSLVWSAPLSTRDGYAYFEGDREQLADGRVGNPVILRYRFLRP